MKSAYLAITLALLAVAAFAQSINLAMLAIITISLHLAKARWYQIIGLVCLLTSFVYLSLERAPKLPYPPLMTLIVVVALLIFLEQRNASGEKNPLALFSGESWFGRFVAISLIGALLGVLRPELWWSDSIAALAVSFALIRYGARLKKQELKRMKEALGVMDDCSSDGGCKGCDSGKGKLFE
ncbi:MAG: hypothetical protein HN353_09905 [Bdellovibrionales bacterium]|jgi:hypothetical protein|nr:hypothetical protein [Bdellovibrionales bacterium]MBT3527213.1 hypothetical protein [Bdellovibrionales bacterium]MBT7670503.1 hypothetical protein [Bdellovibrionales bacterium]MBT7766575.1 hypothetical protein [Bdellovibrionales bacterium]